MLYPLSYGGNLPERIRWFCTRRAPVRLADPHTYRSFEVPVMNRDQLIKAIADALAAVGIETDAEIALERPAQRDHGDWSTNVALATAKSVGRNPRELATELARSLEAASLEGVATVEVAGPGFVNFRLENASIHDVVRSVVEAGDGFGSAYTGEGLRVNVEFVSANPTGPLHAGHARGACFGDTVARHLTHIGFDVSREFYINDRGVQMQAFTESLVARKAGEQPPEGGYKGEYIITWAAEMPDDVDPFEWGYARALEDQRNVLSSLGIDFDTWFSERSMIDTGVIEEALLALAERGVSYEADGATWLASTRFGDDKDRVLVRSNGDYTYLAPDIAYHRDKFSRADRLINVLGADHHGYVVRMKAAMEALGEDPGHLDMPITQLVKLMRDGVEVKISKREGDLIELAEIVEEIGVDATRFTYLLQSVSSPQTFDLAVASSNAMDNPVYYVQMAHARMAGIVRNAADVGVVPLALADVDLSPLEHERELEVMRQLSTFDEVVQLAASERMPHRVTNWLREFAAAVHGFYHDCYVVGEGISPELTQARLQLVEASTIGLRVGLGLLGVSAPEEMR
jgi:arginyl-tRNA synthetase